MKVGPWRYAHDTRGVGWLNAIIGHRHFDMLQRNDELKYLGIILDQDQKEELHHGYKSRSQMIWSMCGNAIEILVSLGFEVQELCLEPVALRGRDQILFRKDQVLKKKVITRSVLNQIKSRKGLIPTS